jgi:hypothetical protein
VHLLLGLSRSNCKHIQLVSLLHTLLGMNRVKTYPVVTPSFWYRGAICGELWGISLISCRIWGLIQRIFLRFLCIKYVNYELYQLYQPYRLNEDICAVSTGSTLSIISPVSTLLTVSTLSAPSSVPTYLLHWSTVKMFSEVKVADLY